MWKNVAKDRNQDKINKKKRNRYEENDKNTM